MDDLLPPTDEELIACVRREIDMRRRVYPRLVGNRQFTQRKADYEIRLMEAVLARLLSP